MTPSLGMIVALNRMSPPPPAWAVVGTLGILVAGFVGVGWTAWSRRQREAPIRQEIAAAPITRYLAPVQVRTARSGLRATQNGTFGLVMRGETFEILHPFALARLLFGQDYCFRACDTTIQAQGEWILIEDRSPLRVPAVLIRNTKMTRQMLVLAGAYPASPPPPSIA
jgi:hypothetical protein